jgi:uncharacterized protein (TIGR02594 family)
MVSADVRRIQEALKAKGFDPGLVDGIWGRATIAAVRKFQAANALGVDGIVGKATSAALFAAAAPGAEAPGADAPAAILPWFEEAKHLVGTKEVLGARSNPVILDWAADLDIRYAGDDIPWCGLFVAHCIGLTLPEETLPGNPLGARQWERFGDRTTPRVGAVMVFWRESRQSGKGHVGFYVGEDDTAYQILGGNQADSVCLTWLSKDRFLAARWPKHGSTLASNPVRKRRDHGLSSNEA